MNIRGTMDRNYSAGELFCGAGGLSRGFETLGFATRFANDLWPAALHTFLMNFDPLYAASNGRKGGVLALPQSVEEIGVEQIIGVVPDRGGKPLESGALDVLLGGPPCQGYSLNSHIRFRRGPAQFPLPTLCAPVAGLSPQGVCARECPGNVLVGWRALL